VSGISLTLIWLLLFPRLLHAPPSDLAALVRPEYALKQLDVDSTDEAALMAALGKAAPVGDSEELRRAVAELAADEYRVRRRAAERLRAAGVRALPFLKEAARSDDPEVRLTARELIASMKGAAAQGLPNPDYLRRLFAIRMLEKRKSRQALPVLRAMLNDEDPTLRDAAREAVAAIEGNPLRRDTRLGLREIAGHLPEDVGFVAVFTAPQAPTRSPLMDMTAPLLGRPGGEGQAIAGFRECVPDSFAPALSRVLERTEAGLLKTIGKCGNVRVDSAVVLFSDRIGAGAGYVAIIVTGAWDRGRIRPLLEDLLDARSAVRVGDARAMVGDKRGFCVLDDARLVISFGAESTRIARLVERLRAEGTGNPPEHLAPAFARAGQGRSYFVAAGSLSEAQRELLRKALAHEIDAVPAEQRERCAVNDPEIAFVRVVRFVAAAERFVAELAEDAIRISITNPDDASAVQCARALSAFETASRSGIATLRRRGVPGPVELLLPKPDTRLWDTEVRENVVEIVGESRLPLIVFILATMRVALPVPD